MAQPSGQGKPGRGGLAAAGGSASETWSDRRLEHTGSMSSAPRKMAELGTHRFSGAMVGRQQWLSVAKFSGDGDIQCPMASSDGSGG
jgi:hypothetical protein